MYMEPIQIASAVVAFAASSVPFYFLFKIKSKKQVVLSSFLAATLIVFGIHSIIETMGMLEDGTILQMCFVVSLSCLIATYYVFKTKKPYSFNGAFGVVMTLVFGIWTATEILENYIPSKESLDVLNSAAMIGFGIFIIARFLWSRKTILYETRTS
jgi:hypothetical protein